VLEAAGVEVDEVKVKSLVAAIKNIDIAKVLEQALAAPVAAVPAAAPAQPAEERRRKRRLLRRKRKRLLVKKSLLRV